MPPKLFHLGLKLLKHVFHQLCVTGVVLSLPQNLVTRIRYTKTRLELWSQKFGPRSAGRLSSQPPKIMNDNGNIDRFEHNKLSENL